MRLPLRFLALAAAMLVVAVGVGAWRGLVWYHAPGPLARPVTVVLPKGAGHLAQALADAGIIDDRLVFRVAARLTAAEGEVKAGEYAVPPAISPVDLLALIRSGRTVVHRLTVPEGLTTSQVLALVEQADALQGSVARPPAEGELFPSTYFYSYGEARQALVDQMRQTMDRTLTALWAGRHAGLPLAGPRDAVILASIVEKETALESERPKIAGVFYNRLRQGMKLQSDPTVIYALTQGRAPLGRPLDHADLATDSPYNTYAVDGLPPGPIDNPGRAALAAVLAPDSTDALYFVADGTGGHLFATTLDAHNKNVGTWRKRTAITPK
jgi:UPF0755 protein